MSNAQNEASNNVFPWPMLGFTTTPPPLPTSGGYSTALARCLL